MISGCSVVGSSHLFAQPPHIWKLKGGTLMEHLPDAAAHVALQAASLADTEPIMQPVAEASAG